MAKSNNIRCILEKIISVMLISGIITIVISPGLCLYLYFLDITLLLFLVMYGKRNNTALFVNLFSAFAGAGIGFVSVKLCTGSVVRFLTFHEILLLCVAVLELACIIFLSHPVRKMENNRTENPDIFPERQYDLDRVKGYITGVEIIGVNASWGMGKTYLMERLKPELQNDFDVIQIDLLSCDLDNVELTIIEEIEKLFRRNGIYSQYSRSMKNTLGKNKWLSAVGGIVLGDTDRMSATFEGYKNELRRLPKKILLIFEDIDRIYRHEEIQKIFAISEKLAGKQLHVIYQYDYAKLVENDFDRDYLEKYIPFSVNLTEIGFERLVDYLWTKLKIPEDLLQKKQIQSLLWTLPGAYEFEKTLGIGCDFSIDLQAVSIRKMQIFLKELVLVLSQNKELQKKDVIDYTIRGVFIKHFLYPYYEQFRIGESPLDGLRICFKEESYTMAQFMGKFRQSKNGTQEKRKQQLSTLKEIIAQKKNREICFVLLFLGYRLCLDEAENTQEGYATESVTNIKNREKNRKIDQVLWNILANGTSELTDMENAVKKLFDEVLKKEGKEQKQAWSAYLNDMWYGRLWKSNRTIFRMGVDTYLPLFQALKVYNAKTDEWYRFLQFYFEMYQEDDTDKTITTKLVDNLNYCDLYKKKVFFQVLRFFNELQVIGNINADISYTNFLGNYLGAIASLGYCKRMEYWMFSFEGLVEQKVDFVLGILDDLEKELREKCEGQQYPYIRDEFSICIAFVEKNRELIKCQQRAPQRGPFSNITEMSSRWTHQEEVDRLKKKRKMASQNVALKNDFLSDLEQSYKADNLYLPEFEDIIKEK